MVDRLKVLTLLLAAASALAAAPEAANAQDSYCYDCQDRCVLWNGNGYSSCADDPEAGGCWRMYACSGGSTGGGEEPKGGLAILDVQLDGTLHTPPAEGQLSDATAPQSGAAEAREAQRLLTGYVMEKRRRCDGTIIDRTYSRIIAARLRENFAQFTI